MKTGLVGAALLLATPLFAASALETAPQEAPTPPASQEQSAVAPANEEEAEQPKAKEKAEKRICRRIRLDASSRRATRVCRTKEEWRQYNNLK